MTPNDLCRTTKEAGTQRALFAWANMAQVYGWEAADQDKSYTVKGHAQRLLELHNDAEPRLKWLYAVTNQNRGGAIAGAIDKSMGVKAGVSDVCLPVRITGPCELGMTIPVYYCGFYIELKRESGGSESKEQKEFGAFVQSQGYKYKCVIGWYLASRLIKEYLR